MPRLCDVATGELRNVGAKASRSVASAVAASLHEVELREVALRVAVVPERLLKDGVHALLKRVLAVLETSIGRVRSVVATDAR